MPIEFMSDEEYADRMIAEHDRVAALKADPAAVAKRLHEAMAAVDEAEAALRQAQFALARARDKHAAALSDFRKAYED